MPGAERFCALIVLLAGCAAAPAPQRLDFDVAVRLSPPAAARLAAQGEGLTVLASYYGAPKPGAEIHADPIGQIALASESATLSTAGTAHLTGAGVSPEALGWLAGPAYVNVNVYSARLSNPDNLLACDFFDGPLSHATAAPVALDCTLIAERVATRARS